jgi:hypothetical protein
MIPRIAVLALLVGCGDPINLHPPSVLDPCPRAAIEHYTAAPDECLTLVSVHDTLFRLDTSDSCGGPPCLALLPGESAYVLERLRPAAPAMWSVWRGPCAFQPACP